MPIRKKIDVCLVVDRSGSLEKEGNIINEALVAMLEAIKREPYLTGCEIYFTMVSFASDMTKNVDFVPIDNVTISSLKLTYTGQTNPGPALAYVVEKAYDRYHFWKTDGQIAFHPLIFFFTDGYPYPIDKYMSEYIQVAEKIKRLEENNKLLLVCAGYGGANIDNLKMLTSYSERVLEMSGGRVDKLKVFFSQIIERTLTLTVTGTYDQLAEMFKDFTQS